VTTKAFQTSTYQRRLWRQQCPTRLHTSQTGPAAKTNKPGATHCANVLQPAQAAGVCGGSAHAGSPEYQHHNGRYSGRRHHTAGELKAQLRLSVAVKGACGVSHLAPACCILARVVYPDVQVAVAQCTAKPVTSGPAAVCSMADSKVDHTSGTSATAHPLHWYGALSGRMPFFVPTHNVCQKYCRRSGKQPGMNQWHWQPARRADSLRPT
jgi:hypothetical protein